jgi:hypothetical protein
MLRKAVFVVIIVLCVHVSVGLSINMNVANAEEGTDISQAIDGLMVPESPAFAILGVTPQSITRPGTPRELAVSVLQGLDAKGHPQDGLAIDTAPYLLFFGNDITLRDYQGSKKIQRLSGIQLSLATAKGTGDNDQAMRVAAGLRWTIWDDGNPRLDSDLNKCIDQPHKEALTKYPPKSAIETADEQEERKAKIATFVESRAKLCRAASLARNWNKSAMDVGIASSWINTNSTNDRYDSDGLGVWTSLSYGFDGFDALKNNSQLIVHARYRTNEEIPDAIVSTVFHKQDSYSLGLKLRYGGPRQTLLFQGIYIDTKPEGQSRDVSYRYSVGGELAVSDNLWLDLEAGGTSGRNDQSNEKFVTTQFKWALAEKKANK